MANKIILPVAFSEPGQFILYTRYGDPRSSGWEERWMNNWFLKDHFDWFPISHLYVHKHFKILLNNAFSELSILGLQNEISSLIKCHYKSRNKSGVLSLHHWGAAIEITPRNSFKKYRRWSKPFIEIMEENDIHQSEVQPNVFSMVHC